MDIQLLKDKLRELVKLSPEENFFYINEALSEEAIKSFEEKHQIRLPKDYRTFLTEMFDGGFGPSQILPLEFWDSIHDSAYLGSLGNDLSKPFPLSSRWDELDNADQIPDEDNINSILNGTIRISHIGCGNFIFLVVNGKEYGNMWLDDRASNGEIVPLRSKAGGRRTFQDWYFDGIDRQIEYHLNKKKREEEKRRREILDKKEIVKRKFYEQERKRDLQKEYRRQRIKETRYYIGKLLFVLLMLSMLLRSCGE